MKICFKIHPDDYDKTANEKFYEEMASKGWLLQKRWANLSKFEKTEPQKLKFDIYYSEDNYVSEEERQEFHSKSRSIVEVRSNVHVSYAPKNVALPPVIKSNEDAAKAIIPLKNKNITRPMPKILGLLIIFLTDFRRGEFTYNAFEYLPSSKEIMYKIITVPEIFIALLIVTAYIIFLAIYEHVRWKKALETFRSGENPDDGNRKKMLYIFSIIMITLSVVFIALFTLCNSSITEKELPETSDGLYLDIHDFEIADKITAKGDNIGGDYFPCRMKHRKTLSAEICMTEEYYYINDKRIIIYQDIISYRTEKTALYAAELLSKDEYKNYEEYNTEGFGKVYVSNENLIAVINNTVYRITFISTDNSIDTSTEKLLDAILEKYNNTMKMSG